MDWGGLWWTGGGLGITGGGTWCHNGLFGMCDTLDTDPEGKEKQQTDDIH